MTQYVILGAGGFARETALVMAGNGRPVAYVSDDKEQWGKWYEYGQCQGSIETFDPHPEETIYFTPGLGSPEVKKRLVERALARGWFPFKAISKYAMLPTPWESARFSVGEGSVICSGVSGTVNVKVCNYVNVNLNCTLGHDCVIEDYVNLTPDVNVSGFVHIEEGADIGCGAVILPHVRIGKGAKIGAGAVVAEDVPAYQTWVGVPAKPLVEYKKLKNLVADYFSGNLEARIVAKLKEQK